MISYALLIRVLDVVMLIFLSSNVFNNINSFRLYNTNGTHPTITANASCGPDFFMCASGECINILWKCDDEFDCADKSDEKNCSFFCQDQYFVCDDGKCISSKWRCDTDFDCSDYSDELNCTFPKCIQSVEFRCDNGKCLHKSRICDGEIDCSVDDSDASDERNCDDVNITCSVFEYYCKNGSRCIPRVWKCDGDYDCIDKSDELNCGIPTCKLGGFKCLNGNCIKSAWLCDGENDCGDNNDEEPNLCSKGSCKPGYFMCKNQVCIANLWLCDGEDDCGDGSDEDPPVCTTKHPGKCRSTQFQCTPAIGISTRDCISRHWRCDGIRDCIDGTDEENCPAVLPCNQFQCHSGQCISWTKKCNGKFECRGGDDEFGCDFKCKKDYYRCGSSYQCINESKVCDGNFDCVNSLDESHKCNKNECEEYNQCSHICKDFTIGYKCSCHKGYKLASDKHTCEDLNECEIPGSCSQLCENRKGTYKCSCLPGYALEGNRFCKALDRRTSLLFSDLTSIRKLEVRSLSKYRSVVTGLHNVIAVACSAMVEYLYWSNMKEKQISRARLSEPTKHELIVQDIGLAEGIAIDWLGRMLYWVDSERKVIEVSDIDGNDRSILVSSGLNNPRHIVVDPTNGNRFLYWTDWGSLNAQIVRISMCGDLDTKQIIFSQAESWPNGMVIDFTIQQLFWLDARRKTLESSKLDGSGYRIVAEKQGQHPFSIAVFEDYAYWTDYDEKTLKRINKFNGKSYETLLTGLIRPMGISTCHKNSQPDATNPCLYNLCSHLCLFSHKYKYRCACPTNFHLLEDGYTCNTSNAYDCKPGQCSHGGTCYNQLNGVKILPKCLCPRGFSGRRCQNRVEYLEPIYRNGKISHYNCVEGYCKYGGTCVEALNHTRLKKPICVCAKRFYGVRCQHYLVLPTIPNAAYVQNNNNKEFQETIKTSVGVGVSILLAGIFASLGLYCYLKPKQRYSMNSVFYNPIYRQTTTEDLDNGEQDDNLEETVMINLSNWGS